LVAWAILPSQTLLYQVLFPVLGTSLLLSTYTKCKHTQLFSILTTLKQLIMSNKTSAQYNKEHSIYRSN